jgi:hypothetical protein
MKQGFEFDITAPPKKGHEDVGLWAFTAFEICRGWRDDELSMPEVWKSNYKLFRGNHWGHRAKPNNVTANLFFANITRTVANVTARHPVAEVIDLDGTAGDLAKVATARLKKWWLDSNQPYKLRGTTLNSEIYGITWEKSVWNSRDMVPGVVICDPFSIFPWPGYWENIATDCPIVCHATALDPKIVEHKYGVKGVEISETYELLGGEREEIVGTSTYGVNSSTSALGEGYSVKPIRSQKTGVKGENALVIEVWCRDFSQGKDGNPLYPGGIRCITIANNGRLVLSDEYNPNLNMELPEQARIDSHLYGRFPFYKNNSYADTTSIFGFSAAEQTAHLNLKIDELVSRLVDYAARSMTGILVIPPNSGLTKASLNTKPNLVVWPQSDSAATGIRFVPMPNPPAIVEKVIDMLITFHDRVHAIQDADRGDTPKQITAASAIVALQERNAVLIQHKIDGIDYLIQERGNYAIAQWQQHGHILEAISAEDETYEFSGVSLAGHKFNYTVESGSTMPKTSLQIQEQAQALFERGAIDQRALLENLNFPKWREIVERMSEDQLAAAINILVQSGLPQEQGQMLLQALSQPQGGPGDTTQTPPQGPPQPGTPRSQQGEMQ